LAIDYLIGSGYRRLAYVDNEPHCEAELPLPSGMKQQLRELKLPQRTLTVRGGNTHVWEDSMAAAAATTGELLAQPERPEVIIYRSYGGAMAGLRCLYDAGLRVPEDIGILVTDSPWPVMDRYMTPRLTYITCERERVADAAFDIIADPSSCHANNIRVDISLHREESTIAKGGKGL